MSGGSGEAPGQVGVSHFFSVNAGKACRASRSKRDLHLVLIWTRDTATASSFNPRQRLGKAEVVV